MGSTDIKVGIIVRHRHLMRGTDLSVIEVNDGQLIVRYAQGGLFQTQDLYIHEVEIFEADKDEYL